MKIYKGLLFLLCFFCLGSTFAFSGFDWFHQGQNPYSLFGAWPANNNTADNAGVATDDFLLNPYSVKNLQPLFRIDMPNNGVDSTPVIAYGTVYIADGNGGVTAVNGQTGVIIWQDELSANGHQESFDESPIITKDKLFIAQDNMFGIDRLTGKVLWSVPVYNLMSKLDVPGISTPADMEAAQMMLAGKDVIYGWGFEDEANVCTPITACTNYPNEHGQIVAVNQDTGNIDWRIDLTIVNGVQFAGGSGTFGQAAVDSGRHMLYIGTSNAYAETPSRYSDALLAIDYDTGKIVWYFQFYANDVWNGDIQPNGTHDLDVRGHPQLFSLPDHFGKVTDYVSITGKDGTLRIFTRDQPFENGQPVLAQPIVQVQLGPATAADGGIQLNPAISNGIIYVPITAIFDPVAGEETLDDAPGGTDATPFDPEAQTHLIAIDLQKLVDYGYAHPATALPLCYGTFTPPLCSGQLPDSAGIIYDVSIGNIVPLNSSGLAYDHGVLFAPGALGTVTLVDANSGNIISVLSPVPTTPAPPYYLPNDLIVGGVSIEDGKIYIGYGLSFDGIVIGSGGLVALGLPNGF